MFGFSSNHLPHLSPLSPPDIPPAAVVVVVVARLYSDEGFDSTKSVYTAKLKELTDLGEPVENRMWETNHRQVR